MNCAGPSTPSLSLVPMIVNAKKKWLHLHVYQLQCNCCCTSIPPKKYIFFIISVKSVEVYFIKTISYSSFYQANIHPYWKSHIPMNCDKPPLQQSHWSEFTSHDTTLYVQYFPGETVHGIARNFVCFRANSRISTDGSTRDSAHFHIFSPSQHFVLVRTTNGLASLLHAI